MKTIAITIDEESLRKIKEMEMAEEKSRSEIVREALGLYLSEHERRVEEQRESAIFRKNKHRLSREAAALIREQKR